MGKKEMMYAIRSAASVAKKDLRPAIARKALLMKLARNKRRVARMISGAVATSTRSQLALRAETAKKIKKTNMRVTAYAARMAANAKATAAKLKATSTSILNKINAERKRASAALGRARSADAARYARTMKYLRNSVAKAEVHSNNKFNSVYRKLAANRARADSRLAAATNGLNDSLAKQAALADSRFSKTVKDLRAARLQASRQVAGLRKAFTSNLATVTSHIKDVETRLTSEISVVSAEVVSVKANQMRVNRRVAGEIRRIRKIANKRHSQARRAPGKLYKRMSKMQSDNFRAHRSLNRSISASKVATRNALKHAKALFASKVVMLSNTVAANLKRNQGDLARVTGVVANIAKANAADRRLIKQQRSAMEADMNKSITRAIQLGEAQAKATAQRIAEYQK